MDIDYHYGTMYVLSRWAEFGPSNSNIIATSAQFVDDNMDDNSFSDKAEKEAIAQGIEIRYSSQNIWNNITGKGNCEVWIPFHFLPGLRGIRWKRNWSAKVQRAFQSSGRPASGDDAG